MPPEKAKKKKKKNYPELPGAEKQGARESEEEITREPHITSRIFFLPKDGLPSGNFRIVESADHPPSVALAPNFAPRGLALCRDS